jgi:hypothetical protein
MPLEEPEETTDELELVDPVVFEDEEDPVLEDAEEAPADAPIDVAISMLRDRTVRMDLIVVASLFIIL